MKSRRAPDPMLSCVCGARFRSASAEAKHRHNFPALCRPARVRPSPDVRTRARGSRVVVSVHIELYPALRAAVEHRAAEVAEFAARDRACLAADYAQASANFASQLASVLAGLPDAQGVIDALRAAARGRRP